MRIDPPSLARSIRATIRRPLLAALPLAVAATSALVPAAAPAAAAPVTSWVTLFQDINYLSYSGPPITLYADTPDLRTVGFDNVASSLFVPAGTRVSLFEYP